mmetsp:Transcript_33689/g.73485  ORF Transcript_33689/g.73485 Transcript_33689/m.73485 type:complete len:262 (-) Transcript_33689:71-856(-)
MVLPRQFHDRSSFASTPSFAAFLESPLKSPRAPSPVMKFQCRSRKESCFCTFSRSPTARPPREIWFSARESFCSCSAPSWPRPAQSFATAVSVSPFFASERDLRFPALILPRASQPAAAMLLPVRSSEWICSPMRWAMAAAPWSPRLAFTSETSVSSSMKPAAHQAETCPSPISPFGSPRDGVRESRLEHRSGSAQPERQEHLLEFRDRAPRHSGEPRGREPPRGGSGGVPTGGGASCLEATVEWRSRPRGTRPSREHSLL